MSTIQVHDKQFGDKKLLKTLWTPEGHFGFDDVFAKFIKEEGQLKLLLSITKL